MNKKLKMILSLMIGLSITLASMEWIDFNKVAFSIKKEALKTVKSNQENLRSISNSPAPKTNNFEFKFKGKKFSYSSESVDTNELAFKKASRECFQYFTKGIYPGEEKGLDIIDSCANPIKGLK